MSSIKPSIKTIRKSRKANKKLYPCFATANALGKFSWGNLPFPQTPMDAIFFKIMPDVFHSDWNLAVGIISKKTAQILTNPNVDFWMESFGLPCDCGMDKKTVVLFSLNS